MRNRKGFTLIELLAVISILAVVSLITAPIIVNTINESRESTNIVSAKNYIRAVDTELKTGNLDNISVQNGYYEIDQDGNICLNEKKNGKCVGKKLKINVKGNKPIRGNVTLEDEEVSRATVVFDEFTVELDYDGKTEYLPVAKKYELGEEVVFNPGDHHRIWNVIGEDTDTVTLMLNQNFLNNIQWYSSTSNSYGPATALSDLNAITKNWTNVDPIDNFTYINNKDGNEYPNGYQKLQITGGQTIITHKDGGQNQLEGISKARFLSLDEFIEISQILNLNLKEDNLIDYIERNLDAVNNLLRSQGLNTVSTVDELIDLYVQLYTIHAYNPRHLTIVSVATFMFSNGIETDYNIYPSEFLYQNLSESESYWLLTSRPAVNTSSLYVKSPGIISSDYVSSSSKGIRPVITIQKSKLS